MVGCIASIACFGTLAIANDSKHHMVPLAAEVRVSLRIEAAPLLPYQAARVRVFVASKGNRPLGPLFPLDQTARVFRVSKPDGATLTARNVTLLMDPRRPAAMSKQDWLNSEHPLWLGPGETVAVSLAFGADWNPSGRLGVQLPTPIFDAWGSYAVVGGYDRAWDDDLEAEPVVLEVSRPTGQDLEVFDLIAGNVNLAAAMLSPVHPPCEEVVPLLEHIPERFPHSSYANYALFALAKHHLGGIVPLASLPEENRLAAIAYLGKIKPKGFAYAPNAMVCLARLLPARDPEAVSIRARLKTCFPNSLVHLDSFAESATPEEWRAIRRAPGGIEDEPGASETLLPSDWSPERMVPRNQGAGAEKGKGGSMPWSTVVLALVAAGLVAYLIVVRLKGRSKGRQAVSG